MFGLSRLGLLGLLVLSFCALLLSEGCGAFNTDLVFQFHYPPNIKSSDGELQTEYKFTKLTLYLVDGDNKETNRGTWEKGKEFPYTEKIDCNDGAIKNPNAHLRFEASQGNKVVLVGRTSLLAACTYKTITFFMAPPGKHVLWEPYGGNNDAKQFKRIGHQVTKLPDGRLLLTGGTSHLRIVQNGPSLACREADNATRPSNAVVYNPATGETTEVTGLKHHRLFHSAVLIGDTVVLHGGLNVEDGKLVSQSEALSASSLQPTATTITQPSRAFHHAFPTTEGQALIHNKFFGGYHFANTPSLEEWRKTDPATGRIWHTSTYIPSEDMLVVAGGLARDKDQWVPSNQLFVYGATESFTRELPGKKGRFGHQAFWDKDNKTLALLGGATGDDKGSVTTSGMQDIILKGLRKKEQSVDMETAPPITARLFHSIVATEQSDGKKNFLLFGGTQTLSTTKQKDLASLPSYALHFNNKVIQRSDNIKLADPDHQTAQFLSQALATNTKDVLSLGGGSLINQKQDQDSRTFLFEARTAGTFISNASIPTQPTEPPPTEQLTDTKTDAGPDTKPEPNVFPDITPPEPPSDTSPETRPETRPEPPVTVGEWEYCGGNRICKSGFHCEASTQRCLKPCGGNATTQTVCSAGRYCVDSTKENLRPAAPKRPGYCLPTCVGTPTKPDTCATNTNTICTISSASPCLRFCRPTVANGPSPAPGAGACRITRGTFGNGDCQQTEYCDLIAQVQPGYGRCTPLPAKEAGKRQEGERCHIQKDPCDGSQGLYCHQDKYSPLRNICRKTCTPGNNSTCASGEECVPVFGQGKPLNAQGGFCAPKKPDNRRADEGNACDNTEQRCKNNLFCARGICSKPCDSLQKANNGCPADSNGCTCGYGFSGQASVCLPNTTSCKDNSDCPSDKQCDDGICLPPRKSAAFELCSSNTECIDGYKCIVGHCLKTCTTNGDNYTQSKDCRADQICAPGRNGTAANQYICWNTCQASSLPTTDCPVGTYCLNRLECLSYCALARKNGPQKLGDRCSNARENANQFCRVGLHCVYDTTKKALTCQQGTKTEGKSCKPSTANELCKTEDGLTCTYHPYTQQYQCARNCNPRLGESNNTACRPSEFCMQTPKTSEFAHPARQGVCITKPTQKAGETCNLTTDLCLPGYKCTSGVCKENNVASSIPCNTNKGIIGNSSCGPKQYCRTYAGELLGYCTGIINNSQTGRVKTIGDACVWRTSHTKEKCAPQLVCNYDTLSNKHSTCLQACNPNASGQPGCPTTQECVLADTTGAGSNINHLLGGKCVNKASRKEGETCDFTHNRCIQGLTCHQGTCRQTCNLAKGTQNNADCSAKSKHATCGCGHATNKQTICMTTCDPSKPGSCPVGQFCQKALAGKQAGCQTPKTGTALPGASCFPYATAQPNYLCQSGFACVNARCTKACSPHISPSGCPSGQTCKPSGESSLGGICRKEMGILEECDKATFVCQTGLLCRGYAMQDGTFKGRCHKECRINADCGGIQFCENNICIGKCDPAKGVSTNSGCPLTHYCPLETPAGAQAGYCVKRPARRGINTQTPRTCEQDNDCTNSQICVERTCLEKCFPPPLQKVQANTACPSNTTCVAALTTEQMNEYGGTCVPSPRQNDGQVCNRTDKLCVQNNTLFCGGVCYKRCDPKHPNPCGGLATCTQYRGVHVCFKNCFVNAVCPFGARCQKSTGAPTRTGICLPSAQAKRLPGAISQIGTACTNQTYNTSCDDNASLYCRYEARNQRTCSKMCDPRNTLPVGSYKCPTGQTCKEDYANSFFGGYCN